MPKSLAEAGEAMRAAKALLENLYAQRDPDASNIVSFTARKGSPDSYEAVLYTYVMSLLRDAGGKDDKTLSSPMSYSTESHDVHDELRGKVAVHNAFAGAPAGPYDITLHTVRIKEKLLKAAIDRPTAITGFTAEDDIYRAATVSVARSA